MDRSEQDTQTAAQRLVADGQPTPSFRLVCVEGPDKGKVFALPAAAAARALVGQSTACTIRLADPRVSRRHAAFEVQGASLRVNDLGSRNGTYANEVAIVEAFLWGGEVLRLGGTTFRVELGDEVVATKLSDAKRFGRLVGESVQMRRLYPFFEQLATSTLPVLIEGETGTGKELLAESLHEASPRASGPFVVFDAAQVAADQIEATLFGDATRAGIFELADRGTLLLDEVGELDAQVQRKLLRVLERGEVQRIGSPAARRVDVRVLASTRLDLDDLVQDRAFREDLYYRLVVSRVELPPLRRREGDVAALARHFWTELGGVGAPADTLLARLARESWPGNVRELRNRIARLVAFGDREDASLDVTAGKTSETPASTTGDTGLFERVLAKDLPLARARELVVSEFERAYVDRVLAANGGSVAKAAAASGLARRYFQLLRAKRSPRA